MSEKIIRSICIKKELWEKVKKLSQKENRSISNYIENFIEKADNNERN